MIKGSGKKIFGAGDKPAKEFRIFFARKYFYLQESRSCETKKIIERKNSLYIFDLEIFIFFITNFANMKNVFFTTYMSHDCNFCLRRI